MLHNHVSLLKWHLFILSIQLLSVIGPCTSDGIIFNGTALPIDITTTCHLWLSPGALNFFFFFFFVGRDVRVGSLKWPGALVFQGRYRPHKTSCKMTFKSHRKHVFSRWVYQPYKFFQSRFVYHNLLRGGGIFTEGGISILIVGRPPPPRKRPRNR